MRFCALACTIVLSVIIVSSPGCKANPIPEPESDGVPTPTGSHLGILFKSEKVVYTIDNEETARVVAVYVLQNSAYNKTILNISLPFSSRVPKGLKLASNGLPVPFMVRNSFYLHYPYYSYARFQLDFAACETITLIASYSLQYSVSWDPWDMPIFPDRVYTQRFWCEYIAETGRYWDNDLDTAEFQFRIKKDLYGSGLEGFQKAEESGYIVATKKYTNWKPEENIDARWERPDYYRTIMAYWFLFLIVIIAVIEIVLAFVYFRLKKKRKAPGKVS